MLIWKIFGLRLANCRSQEGSWVMMVGKWWYIGNHDGDEPRHTSLSSSFCVFALAFYFRRMIVGALATNEKMRSGPRSYVRILGLSQYIEARDNNMTFFFPCDDSIHMLPSFCNKLCLTCYSVESKDIVPFRNMMFLV